METKKRPRTEILVNYCVRSTWNIPYEEPQ